MLNFNHSLRYTVCIRAAQQSLVRGTGTLLAVMHLMIIIHYELEKNISYMAILFQQYYQNMKQYQQISVEVRSQNCKKQLIALSCTSACHNLAPTGRIFRKFYIRVFFEDL